MHLSQRYARRTAVDLSHEPPDEAVGVRELKEKQMQDEQTGSVQRAFSRRSWFAVIVRRVRRLLLLIDSPIGSESTTLDQVRCRRLAVVDSDGRERIVAEVHGDAARVLVATQRPPGSAGVTGVELVADGYTGDELIGIHLVGAGTARGSFVLAKGDDRSFAVELIGPGR